jgi:hypothetical protein
MTIFIPNDYVDSSMFDHHDNTEKYATAIDYSEYLYWRSIRKFILEGIYPIHYSERTKKHDELTRKLWRDILESLGYQIL